MYIFQVGLLSKGLWHFPSHSLSRSVSHVEAMEFIFVLKCYYCRQRKEDEGPFLVPIKIL